MDGLTVPNVTVPAIEIPPPAVGGGGGGKGGGKAGRKRNDGGGSPFTSGLGTMEFSGLPSLASILEPGIQQYLDSLQPTVTNITVNTVTADANLPNLIVEALQTYNLYNGPVDVQIAA
ncbi:MAG: hypothetical protein EBR06_06800 [Acidimicrobiia bacterium]|nr:hypothetical protein [Acidimicrobiia bacterium]